MSLVMILQPVLQCHKLPVGFRIRLFQGRNRLGGTDSRYHVLSLGVHEVLAVKNVLSCGRIPGKADSGTGGISKVAEHPWSGHLLLFQEDHRWH